MPRILARIVALLLVPCLAVAGGPWPVAGDSVDLSGHGTHVTDPVPFTSQAFASREMTFIHRQEFHSPFSVMTVLLGQFRANELGESSFLDPSSGPPTSLILAVRDLHLVERFKPDSRQALGGELVLKLHNEGHDDDLISYLNRLAAAANIAPAPGRSVQAVTLDFVLAEVLRPFAARLQGVNKRPASGYTRRGILGLGIAAFLGRYLVPDELLQFARWCTAPGVMGAPATTLDLLRVLANIQRRIFREAGIQPTADSVLINPDTYLLSGPVPQIHLNEHYPQLGFGNRNPTAAEFRQALETFEERVRSSVALIGTPEGVLRWADMTLYVNEGGSADPIAIQSVRHHLEAIAEQVRLMPETVQARYNNRLQRVERLEQWMKRREQENLEEQKRRLNETSLIRQPLENLAVRVQEGLRQMTGVPSKPVQLSLRLYSTTDGRLYWASIVIRDPDSDETLVVLDDLDRPDIEGLNALHPCLKSGITVIDFKPPMEYPNILGQLRARMFPPAAPTWRTLDDVRHPKVEPVWGDNLTIRELPYLLNLHQVEYKRLFRKDDREPVTSQVINPFERFFARSLLNAANRLGKFPILAADPSGGLALIKRSLLTEPVDHEALMNYTRALESKVTTGGPEDARAWEEYKALQVFVIERIREADLYIFRHHYDYSWDISHTFHLPIALPGSAGEPSEWQIQLQRETIVSHNLVQMIGGFWEECGRQNMKAAADYFRELEITYPYYFALLQGQVVRKAESGSKIAREVLDSSPVQTSFFERFEGPLRLLHLDDFILREMPPAASAAKPVTSSEPRVPSPEDTGANSVLGTQPSELTPLSAAPAAESETQKGPLTTIPESRRGRDNLTLEERKSNHIAFFRTLLSLIDHHGELRTRGITSQSIWNASPFLNVGLATKGEILRAVNITTYLRARGYDAVGLDLQAEDKEGFVRGDVQDKSSFRDDQFGAAISVGLFESGYISSLVDYRYRKTFYRKSALEFKRVIKDRGFLLLDTFFTKNQEFMDALRSIGFEIFQLQNDSGRFLAINHKESKDPPVVEPDGQRVYTPEGPLSAAPPATRPVQFPQTHRRANRHPSMKRFLLVLSTFLAASPLLLSMQPTARVQIFPWFLANPALMLAIVMNLGAFAYIVFRAFAYTSLSEKKGFYESQSWQGTNNQFYLFWVWQIFDSCLSTVWWLPNSRSIESIGVRVSILILAHLAIVKTGHFIGWGLAKSIFHWSSQRRRWHDECVLRTIKVIDRHPFPRAAPFLVAKLSHPRTDIRAAAQTALTSYAEQRVGAGNLRAAIEPSVINLFGNDPLVRELAWSTLHEFLKMNLCTASDLNMPLIIHGTAHKISTILVLVQLLGSAASPLTLASQSLLVLLNRLKLEQRERGVPSMRDWGTLLVFLEKHHPGGVWPTLGAEFHQELQDGIDPAGIEKQKSLAAAASQVGTSHVIEPYIMEGQDLLDLRVLPGPWPIFLRLVHALKETGLLVDQKPDAPYQLPYHTSIEGDWSAKAPWFLLGSFALGWPSWTMFAAMDWQVAPGGNTHELQPGQAYTYIGVTVDPRTGEASGKQTNILDGAMLRETIILDRQNTVLGVIGIEPYGPDLMRKGLLAAAWRQQPHLVEQFQGQLKRWLVDTVGLSEHQIQEFEKLTIHTAGWGMDTTNPKLGTWFSNLQAALLRKAALEATQDLDTASTEPALLDLAYETVPRPQDWTAIASALDQWRLEKAVYQVTGHPGSSLASLNTNLRQEVMDILRVSPLSQAQAELEQIWDSFLGLALKTLYPSVVLRKLVTTLANVNISTDHVLNQIKGELELLAIDPDVPEAEQEVARQLLNQLNEGDLRRHDRKLDIAA